MFLGVVPGLIAFGNQMNKALEMDEQCLKKNIKAYTRTADAEKKLEYYNEMAFKKLSINAKRKHGLLTCHLKMFQQQYDVIRKIEFKRGKGIEELENMDIVQNAIHQYMNLPAIVSGKVMTDSQLLVSLAIHGISGQILQDSKKNLKLASTNLAQANAFSAQTDTMCIALEGIANHVEIVTELMQKLGMLYMKSIKNISQIIERNGTKAELYSNEDIDAINVSLAMTKLVYRIINTPLIDADGNIEQESKRVISEGNALLNQI